MAAKEKVIGFKVSEESNLLRRLKMVVRRTGLNYGELLEKWVSREEAELSSGSLFGQFDPSAESGSAEGADFQTRIDELEARLAVLEAVRESQSDEDAARAEAPETEQEELTEEKAEQRDEYDEPSETDSGAVIASEFKSFTPEQIWEKTKDYIRGLWNDGNGLNKSAIAAQLMEEGILTKAGKTKWYPNLVTRAIEEIEE